MATKIIRGGCFGDIARRCRAAYSDVVWHSGVRYDFLGFRPVAEVKETSEKGEDRVLRGGSWCDVADFCRAAFRFGDVPGRRDSYDGFRPVANVTEVSRVVRGGSWFLRPSLRCTIRFRAFLQDRHCSLGFRPVANVTEVPEKEKRRMVRGGSFWFEARTCRSAYRYWLEPGLRHSYRGFRLVALALVLLLACLLFEGCTTPRCSDFCGPGEARFCLPDDMRHALEKVDEMEKTGDRGPCHWDGPRYLITRHYLGARNDFQTEISRTVILMPGDAQCILIVESLRKDSPTGRQTETFLVPVTVEKR